MAAGLAYSVPMLIEVVMSPQMNVWVYGFFQHDFWQTVRYGGYRPVVFLPHGLWVAFFAFMALAAAVTLFRHVGPEARPKALVVMLYLAAMLVLCRSAGPLVYALGMVPLILLVPVRLQLVIAAGLAVLVVTYPVLRGAHLVPIDQILAFADTLSPDRAYSLRFRIDPAAGLGHSQGQHRGGVRHLPRIPLSRGLASQRCAASSRSSRHRSSRRPGRRRPDRSSPESGAPAAGTPGPPPGG